MFLLQYHCSIWDCPHPNLIRQLGSTSYSCSVICTTCLFYFYPNARFSDFTSVGKKFFYSKTLKKKKLWNEMKNEYYNVGIVPKSIRKIVETDPKSILLTHIHDRSLSWIGTGTSIKSGGVKLVLWTQTSILSDIKRSCKCFPHASKLSNPTYKWVTSVVVEKLYTSS